MRAVVRAIEAVAMARTGAIPEAEVVVAVSMVVLVTVRVRVPRVHVRKARARKAIPPIVPSDKVAERAVVVVAIAVAVDAIAESSMVVRTPVQAGTLPPVELALANRPGWRAFEASASADAFFVFGHLVSLLSHPPRFHGSYG